jgi:hypothetical protein
MFLVETNTLAAPQMEEAGSMSVQGSHSRKIASVSVGEAKDDLYVTVPRRSEGREVTRLSLSKHNPRDARLYPKNTQRALRLISG